jgi:hypothetical protein
MNVTTQVSWARIETKTPKYKAVGQPESSVVQSIAAQTDEHT